MSRALVAAGALLALGLVHPVGAASPVTYPSPGCFTVFDAFGDVQDPDLDVLEVALKTTGSSLQAYVRVHALAAAPKGAEGHRFAFAFTFNGHRLEAAGSAFSRGSAPVRDAAAVTGLTGRSTQLTVDQRVVGGHQSSGLTVTFDTTRSFVVFDLPISDIVRHAGAAFVGRIAEVEVTSAYDAYVASTVSDTTTPQGFAVAPYSYAIGDNRCFGPAPAVLTLLSSTQAQYGDLVHMSARLQDESGRVLAQRPISFSLGSARQTATTGDDGVVRTTLDPRLAAGVHTLTLSFAGDSTAGAVSSSRAFSVVAERTVMTLKNQTPRNDRSVVATLRDDDGRAVPGVPVTFTVAGQSAGTVVTSAQGTAELHRLAPGVVVQVSFAGVSGQYTPSSASIKTTGKANNGTGHDGDA